MRLSEILAPYDARSFLVESWGNDFVYIPGSPGKFRDLFSWKQLNRSLEEQRLDSPRLRLELQGSQYQELPFITYRTARRGGLIPRLDVPTIYRFLREGATLVFDAIDEANSNIAATCESLAGVFRTHIQVNVYASWGSSAGFGLHWDDHDVIAIQIAGRKRWKLYGPTRPHPLYRDVERNDTRPTVPVWDEVITAGDVLYVPRGHWHEAIGLNEPTLHLTFGVNTATGVDLIQWLADEVRSIEAFRKNLPLFATDAEKVQWSAILREKLDELCQTNLVSKYIESLEMGLGSRPHLSLPDAATASGLPRHDYFKIGFCGSAVPRLNVDEQAGTVRMNTLGREWTFSATAYPILDAITSQTVPCEFSSLINKATGTLTPKTLRSFLSQLVAEGLIFIVPSDDQ